MGAHGGGLRGFVRKVSSFAMNNLTLDISTIRKDANFKYVHSFIIRPGELIHYT